MNWTALVPLKHGAERKTRLAGVLSREERIAMTEAMTVRLLSCLREVDEICQTVLLAPAPMEGVLWRTDGGRGVNRELAAYRAENPATALLIIHPDLPDVTPADIAVLLAATSGGRIAIAPDRHGTGTNALALPADATISFAFGPNSCARHRAAAGSRAAIVKRHGLALDIDEPEDLALMARGECWQP